MWTGTLLSNNSELKRIVQNALDSIAAALLPIVQGAGYTEKVIKEHFRPSSKDVDQVYKAVKKARDKIKGYCQARANGGGGRVAPQGLRQRMQVLGWR